MYMYVVFVYVQFDDLKFIKNITWTGRNLMLCDALIYYKSSFIPH